MSRLQSEATQRQPSAGDVAILVMGVTGVGKSTFISRLTGEDAGIGHDLTPYTKGVGIHSTTLNGRTILKEIAFISSQIYRQGMKLAGILYLHRISDNRVTGAMMRNFKLLENICGAEAAARVFLVTTMWNLVETERLSYREAAMRETRLSCTMEFWGKLCEQGSQVRRWQGDEASASSIIRELLFINEKDGFLKQRLQRELVNEGKDLSETAAGNELSTEYLRKERKCIEGLWTLEHGTVNDPETANAMKELRGELEGMRSAQRELNVSIQNVFSERQEAYRKVLSMMRAEQQQLSAELEQSRSKYQQLKVDMTGNKELIEEERREWQLKRMRLGREELTGRRTRQSLEAERRRIDKEELELNEQYYELQRDKEENRIEVEEAVAKLRKRDVMKKNLIAFLGVLGGTGLAVAGVVTGIAPLAGSGIGMGFASAAKFKFSRMPKDHERRRFSMQEALLGGGQGAAGASIN
ncbi:hypothetical protein EDB81DRAFT_950889 [Dactylonectria macrodidyma]|uniref:G domain-containing protein n=1 Tax=Dactylonectria macrodidyma TaxID=307937 RepID=A0A9P9E186_9HYPO|nr:hypothetical protein EDB81DRAFT_950889 [Dactylonectria macrodidyma]